MGDLKQPREGIQAVDEQDEKTSRKILRFIADNLGPIASLLILASAILVFNRLSPPVDDKGAIDSSKLFSAIQALLSVTCGVIFFLGTNELVKSMQARSSRERTERNVTAIKEKIFKTDERLGNTEQRISAIERSIQAIDARLNSNTKPLELVPLPVTAAAYIDLWSGFSGVYYAYNPDYDAEDNPGFNTRLVYERVFAERFRRPDLEYACYVFMTDKGDQHGRRHLERFATHMKKMIEAHPDLREAVFSKLQIWEVQGIDSHDEPKAYLGDKDGAKVVTFLPVKMWRVSPYPGYFIRAREKEGDEGIYKFFWRRLTSLTSGAHSHSFLDKNGTPLNLTIKQVLVKETIESGKVVTKGQLADKAPSNKAEEPPKLTASSHQDQLANPSAGSLVDRK